jgi:hypothetical protein
MYMANLHGGKEYFVKKGLDDRTAINYAVVGAGYAAAFGELPLDFQKYMVEESTRSKESYDAEQAVGVFFSDLLAFQSSGLLKHKLWEVDGDRLYLYFNGLYIIWSGEYRKVHGTEPFKAASIRDYLREEPGFLDFDVLKRINNRMRRCVVFLLSEISDDLRSLIDEESKVQEGEKVEGWAG